MPKLNRKHLKVILMVIFFIFLFLLYSWFNWSVLKPLAKEYNYQYIFNWPDAMANNYFIDNFIESSNFTRVEPLNVILNDIIRPRSTNIVNHNLVPSGFLGFLIIYGWIGKLLTNNLIIYLTPIIASIGVFLSYFFVKELINKRAAIISALLMASLAPYIFFANQTMLATIPFLIATLGGFYCLMRSSTFGKGKKVNSLIVLSGFLIGCAISIRYQEALWIVASLLIVWLSQFKIIKFKQVLLFILGSMVSIGLVLFYNWQTYGEIFTVGYLRMNDQTVDIVNRLPTEILVYSHNSFITYLKLIFLPFGFSARNIYHNFIQYVWAPYSPYLVLLAIGVVVWSAKFKRASFKQKIYAICASLSCTILIFYYGSWVFADNMVLQNNTISSSYTRYWLPALVMILPIIGYLFDSVLEKAQKRICNRTLLVFITIILLLFISITKAFTTVGDGLIAQASATQSYYERADKVRSVIESESLLLVEREDKIFFPTYKVITFEHDYSIFSELKNTLNANPVYYLSVSTDNDIQFINSNKLKAAKVEWELVREIDAPFRLFKLKPAGD